MEKHFENVDRQLTYDFTMSQNDLDLKNFIVVKFECIIISNSTIATKKGCKRNFNENWPRSFRGEMTLIS